MADIFIDAQIANKLAKGSEYRDFIQWLMTDAVLMISDKLLKEYCGGNAGCGKATAILTIVALAQSQNRIKKIPLETLTKFKKDFIDDGKRKIKSNGQKLLSNWKDWWHFPLVFNAPRKLGIVADLKFKYDLENFPRFSKGVQIYTSIEDCQYK